MIIWMISPLYSYRATSRKSLNWPPTIATAFTITNCVIGQLRRHCLVISTCLKSWNLMETEEERLSSYSLSLLSAVQISCHITEGETAEDWRGWFHLNNFMLWLAELTAHRPTALMSEEDRLGKIKTQVQSNIRIQSSALWRKKTKNKQS